MPYDVADISKAAEDKNRNRRTGRPTERPAGAKARPTLPMENYDELTVDDISSRLEGLSRDELEAIRSYEQRHKNRRTLHENIDARLREFS